MPYRKVSCSSKVKMLFNQVLMEVGVILGIFLNAQLNVVEDLKPERDYVTTLLLWEVVQAVWEKALRLKRVTPNIAQVIH